MDLSQLHRGHADRVGRLTGVGVRGCGSTHPCGNRHPYSREWAKGLVIADEECFDAKSRLSERGMPVPTHSSYCRWKRGHVRVVHVWIWSS